jgi:THO complex subunit 1 transcription elongation factor
VPPQVATELAAEARRAAHAANADGQAADAARLAPMRALPTSLLLDAVRLTPIQQVQHFVPVVQRAGFVADIADAHNAFTHGCRVLIQKVSQLEDAALLGSLMRWMCTVLPVDHRPALNISNVINAESHKPHVEEVAAGAVDSLGMAVDGQRYAQFWRLQESLQQADVLTTPERWTEAAAQIEAVLSAFDGPVQASFCASVPGEVVLCIDIGGQCAQWHLLPVRLNDLAGLTPFSSETVPLTQVDSASSLASLGESTVAFLTSPSLLTLQLPDATFRRQVLSEVMMLLHRGTKYGAEGARDVPEKMARACDALLPRVRAAMDATGASGLHFRGALRPPWRTFARTALQHDCRRSSVLRLAHLLHSDLHLTAC